MTDADRLARCYALLDRLRAARMPCRHERDLADALGVPAQSPCALCGGSRLLWQPVFPEWPDGGWVTGPCPACHGTGRAGRDAG